MFSRPRKTNANPPAYRSIIGQLNDAGKRIQWGKTRNKIGFIAIGMWDDEEIPQRFDEVLEKMRDTRGLIKLVADVQSNKLLGAHILAPEGADSIQTAVMAIKAGMTISDLSESIFPYLTTVEGLKLAALAFDKDVKKLSCCAG